MVQPEGRRKGSVMNTRVLTRCRILESSHKLKLGLMIVSISVILKVDIVVDSRDYYSGSREKTETRDH
jgi:hypothetical protein